MPKRWERELRRLGEVPAPTERIHARSTRPSEPLQGDEMPPTRQRVLAGVVAFGVFIAAGAFLVRAIDPTRPERAPGTAAPLPTLRMTFESRGPIDDGAGDMVRVDTVLDYGDLHEESFTSTLPPGGIVDWVSVDQLTPMFPAPTAGSDVSIEADGGDPRVLIGEPGAWPDSDRFERIDRLPAEPGQYVLIFEADYPEGVARTARLVDLVKPGTVQIVAKEGGDAGKATASIAIDGALTDGIRRASSFHYSDVISQFPGEPPPITPTFVHIEAEADVVVGEGPTNQQLRISAEPPPWDDGVGTRLPRESLAGIDAGRYLLTYDVAWKHGKVSWTSEGTLETARFAFPIEIVEALPAPSVPTDRDVVTVAMAGDPPAIHLSYGASTYAPLTTDIIDDRVLISIPAGTAVRIDSGVATSWAADIVELRRDNALGSGVPRLPMLEGTALWSWKFTLPDGTRVTGLFAIELLPAATGEPSDVLRVRCDGGKTTVLTPVVAAQEDGVRVVVEPVGPPAQIRFRQVGITGAFGGSIDADGASHPWPIAPGPTEVQCGPDPSGFEEAATFEVVDPAGHWAEPVLACGDAGSTEVVGYDGGAAEWVDEPAAIRGILRGVLPDDRVMRPLYGRDRLDRWVIVRGGEAVGLVWFTWVTDASDPRGGGLARVDSDVCVSAGIDGSVPPRDPDEDGVELDCRAGSQVAFPPMQEYAAVFEGSGYIRDNVPGIRSDDDVVPPPGVDGSEGFEGTWTVEREGKAVASVVYPTLQGITCRWNAIGVPESG